MKQRIIESINSPENLEKLYRDNRQAFCKSFAEISDDYNSDLVRYWKIRLSSESQVDLTGFSKVDLFVVIAISIISGLLVKLPDMISQINHDAFYTRNLAIIVINGIIVYTFFQNRIFNLKKILFYCLTILILVLFVNLLPHTKSDSITLSFIHSPLFLWSLFGLAYISFDFLSIEKRIEFIRFNGEFLIMTGLLVIAGGLLTAITIGLFSAIKLDIEEFYIDYVIVFGGVATPIVSLFLIKLYPNITNKIAPVIAKVFTPLVLITMVVYLISFIFSKSKILEDRDLLILFNIMLLAVMAIIVFSVLELDKKKAKNINVLILFLVALLAIIINSIALIAIIKRVTYGLTPNRVVVLVSNVLIFLNLIQITKYLYLSYFKSNQLKSLEKTVAKYLLIYFIYSIVVIFILPFVFGFR